MKALEGGLQPFLTSLLPSIAKDVGQPKLTPAHIGLAGHSAGGYKGINEALGGAGRPRPRDHRHHADGHRLRANALRGHREVAVEETAGRQGAGHQGRCGSPRATIR